MVPDEVLFEVPSGMLPQTIAALEQRHGLIHLDQLVSQLSGSTIVRARIQGPRTVTAVVLAVQADPEAMSAQPNYLFALQQNAARRQANGNDLQYALAKLRLPEAHRLATGHNVLVAIIDSGVDVSHPELYGAITETFDALDGSDGPHSHGTAIAGVIAARATLVGAAPAARILAVRAFDQAGAGTEGTTFAIIKGLDWAAAKGARVVNLSFAGPSDPALGRSLEGAHRNGIVLVAAAGNAGPRSPPLYPAADPSVIAVTATDAQDKIFEASNRGRHVSVAAPGVDILVAAPGERYQISSGTSFAAAEVTGIVALMIELRSDLTLDAIRATFLATGRPLGPGGQGALSIIRLVDSYQAVTVERARPVVVR